MNTNKKYELTDETITFNARLLCAYYDEDDDEICEYEQTTVHRIKAIRDFGDVHAGDLGGWIEKEENLSQDGDCWVSDDARIYDDAKISGNAKVSGKARVYGAARIFEFAVVYGESVVAYNAEIFGDARVCEYARVFNTKLNTGKLIR